MDNFTFPALCTGRQCKELQAAFHPQLDLSGCGSPPPCFNAVVATGSGGEQEDKMDMLWEDFNEQLTSVPPLCHQIDKRGLPMTKDAWLDDDVVAAGLMEKRVGRLLRAHESTVVRRRRWSMLLMLNLLKNLFLVKKTRNPRTAPI